MPPTATIEGAQAEAENTTSHSPSEAALNALEDQQEAADSAILREELGLPNKEADIKDETPSGGSPDSGAEQMWRPEAAGIATGIQNTETHAAEAVVGDATPKITPISTEIPDTPRSPDSTPMDSAFVAEAPFSEEKKDMQQANEEFDQQVAETQAAFEKKIGDVEHIPESTVEASVDPSGQVNSISNPEERFEARQESIKGIIAQLKGDLMDANEVYDRRLAEAQTVFEEKITRANSLESEAESLAQQLESKKMEAFNIKTEAQNELEKIQGLVAGKKAEIAAKQEKIESLAV